MKTYIKTTEYKNHQNKIEFEVSIVNVTDKFMDIIEYKTVNYINKISIIEDVVNQLSSSRYFHEDCKIFIFTCESDVFTKSLLLNLKDSGIEIETVGD